MEPKIQPTNQDSNHSGPDIWHKLAHYVLVLVVGFIGGSLAIRLYNQTAVFDGQSDQSTQIVLQESEVIGDIVERIGPSVVSITVESRSSGGFFGQTLTQESAGTGIIVSADGLVLTNRHVIPESAVSVTLVGSDGTVYEDVEVVDRDIFNDIAFLKIKDASGLQAAPLGSSSEMRVGDKVIAIGNALGQFENTVTTGIISGVGRPIVAGDSFESQSLQNLIQTDTAINPGNSGGPLVNINGEVIGVNTAVAGGAENIGFAIPIDDVKPLLNSVVESGEIIRPYLGVRYIQLTPSIAQQLGIEREQGALITAGSGVNAVLPNSPADKAGLKAEDIIIKVNTEDVDAERPLQSILSRFSVGDTIILRVERGDSGEEENIEVTLEAAPEEF